MDAALEVFSTWGLDQLAGVDSPAKLPAAASVLEGLRYARLEGPGGRRVTLGLRGERLSMTALMQRSDPLCSVEELRERRAAWMERWPDRGMVGPILTIELLGLAYRKPLPPRVGFAEGCLVNWFQAEATDGRFGEGTFERLRQAALPEGASRKEDDRELCVQWDSGAAPDLEARLLAADVWLGQNLWLPRSADFLPNGDGVHQAVGLRPSVPFGLYEPITGWGYVPLVAGWTPADLEPGLMALSRGTTDTGESVGKVLAIFPNRELALSERKALRELGVARVLYATEGGGLANPYPPGKWKDIHDWWDKDL